MIHRRSVLLAIMALALVAGGCKKKEDNTIIVKKAQLQPKRQTGTGQMSPTSWQNNVAWLGATYSVSITRKPDPSLPHAKDESGHDYLDNTITLTVKRVDGSQFFSRTFTKSDFRQYVPEGSYANGALLGLVYDHSDASALYFGTSVGSPDNMSDEYVPLILKLDRNGAVSISKDDDLDGSPEQADKELQQAEEDGV